MVKHRSMVFDQRTKHIHPPNSKTPITGLSKISQPQVSLKKNNIISNNPTPAQLKLVREWRSMKKMNIGFRPSRPNVDDDFLEVQPFLEKPVSFNFGDDYGNHLFLDLQKELSYIRANDGLFLRGRGINAVKSVKNSDDDIYILASETDMINSFLRDTLF